jgi:asparagine synthase (glutamine-hydrolysing)
MINAITIRLRHDPLAMSRVARSMSRQGFTHVECLTFGDGAADAWARGPHSPGSAFLRSPLGSGCVVGTLWYKRRFARDALRALIDGIANGHDIAERDLGGNFMAFIDAGGRRLLLGDALGFCRIYECDHGNMYSTSWLAARAWCSANDIDEDAATQYVLLGAAHSECTPVRGILQLPIGSLVDLKDGRVTSRFPEGIGRGGDRYSRIDEAVEALADRLRQSFRSIAEAFPGRTVAALSGGFDSRLILAGLLDQGERPRLFVYGNSESNDVRIARSVADAIGLPIEAIDKEEMNDSSGDLDVKTLIANAVAFDGLPNDGVMDGGADLRTRVSQSANSAIALNGGGGEIFRNFFHLPSGRFRSLDIVQSFYRGFDRSVFRRRDGLARYRQCLVASIEQTIARSFPSPASEGNVRPKHSREAIESLYPFFRCHYWMSVNNSLALRMGHFLTPLVDLELARDACLLPLAWKNAGLLEARLIAALNSKAAAQMSSYGFRFADGPGLWARASEWGMLLRPVAMRPGINALRRRLGGVRAPANLVARWRQRLPGEWRIESALDLSRLTDTSALSRALALEVVARRLVD